ncbi:MAG: cupin domain-containing protein [Pyrinomonadaceae bacterium]
MKDQIQSAQIVLPCADFNRSLKFFTERLGFRVEMIFPADAPSIAVVSGYGVALRLEESKEILPLTLRLVGDFSAEMKREISSPDGVRVILIDAESPIEIPEAAPEFVVSTLDDENSWSEGRAGMRYRDLIPGRLGGRFVASHISIPVGGEVPDYVHFHRVRFQMIYCIAGWAKLVYENQGEPFLMNAGDCVLQPPEIRHRVLESSAKFEVLEIGCPAIHETFADHKLNLPNEIVAPEKNYGNQRFLHHVAAKSVWEKSPIAGFETRDTGIAEATNGLADVRVFRAVANSRFSIKHSDEFLFFYILANNLRLSGGAEKTYRLGKNDAFILPADSEYFIDADSGLEMIRVNLPAE